MAWSIRLFFVLLRIETGLPAGHALDGHLDHRRCLQRRLCKGMGSLGILGVISPGPAAFPRSLQPRRPYQTRLRSGSACPSRRDQAPRGVRQGGRTRNRPSGAFGSVRPSCFLLTHENKGCCPGSRSKGVRYRACLRRACPRRHTLALRMMASIFSFSTVVVHSFINAAPDGWLVGVLKSGFGSSLLRHRLNPSSSHPVMPPIIFFNRSSQLGYAESRLSQCHCSADPHNKPRIACPVEILSGCLLIDTWYAAD